MEEAEAGDGQASSSHTLEARHDPATGFACRLAVAQVNASPPCRVAGPFLGQGRRRADAGAGLEWHLRRRKQVDRPSLEKKKG